LELLRKWDCNVPTLRFAEFTDEWGKYELSHFVTRITRRNKNNESSLPLTISAQYGLVDQISFFNKTVASVDLSGYYLLYNGDFAYNKSYSNDYAWGAVKRLDKYEKGCLSSLYFVFRPNDNIDSDYLTHYFESSKWHKGISNIAGEGARNHGLLNMAVDDYFATKHYLPSLPEQRKIARVFNAITRRIEIQNKIIEDLKVLKKELCKVLLNNKEWPKFRIRDIANLGRGRVINTDEINSQKFPLYPVYSSQTSNNGIMGYLEQYDFEGEYITWTTDGANAGTVFYRNGRFNCTNVCGTLKLTVDFDYYITALSIQMVTEKYVSKNLANPKLMNNVMAEIEIFMPDIRTQKNLSNLFLSLDKKIESAGKLLSCFVSEKKFLLTAMFI
jgi:type I restriction enzyme S subunit